MTQILKSLLIPGTVQHLEDLYTATNCKTKKERHNCRGCLSSLQKSGKVISLGNSLWKGL